MLGFAFLPPWNRYAISATAEKKNKRARRFMEGLGFRQEGVLHDVVPGGGNLLIYALLRPDFVNLIQKYRGQQAADDFLRHCQ
jgi:RimJ/RimL family protein N-acetyltransferase